MNRIWIGIAVLCIHAGLAFGEPTPVKVGIYINDVYDIDTEKDTFNVDAWIWSLSPDGQYDFTKTKELLNAREFKSLFQSREIKSNQLWVTEKIKGSFQHNFDTRNFPFDKHELQIVIEDSLQESSKIKFIADLESSKIDPYTSVKGWKILDFKIETKEHTYDTGFGDMKNRQTSYPQVVAKIKVQRNGFGFFLRGLTALYLCVIASLLAMFLKTSSEGLFGARISLLVSLLMTVTFHQHALKSIIGRVASMTLVDRLHIVGFITIFGAIVCTLFSRKLCEDDKKQSSHEFDRNSIAILAIMFMIANLWLIALAMK